MEKIIIDRVKMKLELQWKNRRINIDWAEVEQLQRSVLHALQLKEISASQAVMLIDEILAAYTRRGHELIEVPQ